MALGRKSILIRDLFDSPLQAAIVVSLIVLGIVVLFALERYFRANGNADILESIFALALVAFPVGLIVAGLGFATHRDNPLQVGLTIVGISTIVGMTAFMRYAHH